MMGDLRQCGFGLLVVGMLLGSAGVAQADVCGVPSSSVLVAGQHFWTGTVSVYNDEAHIYVQFTTDTPWVMGDAHVAVAGTLQGIPQTKNGNPMPGRFAYHATFDPQVSTYTFVIPAAGIFTPGQTVVIAAHAVVHAPKSLGGSQTAWGLGAEFPGENWATYMTYQVQHCGGGSPE